MPKPNAPPKQPRSKQPRSVSSAPALRPGPASPAVAGAAGFRPLAELDARAVRGVLTDIDDTLTRAGRLAAPVYDAIARLVAAGIAVVPVTGRSAGWAHLIVHHWPVEAVVTESGGLCLHWRERQLQWLFHGDRAQIAADRAEMARLADAILAAFPSLQLANDNAFRLVDFAIDHSESVQPPAAPAVVQAAIEQIRAAGFQARASSVHINAWRGHFDKAPMALRYLTEIRGETEAEARAGWCFIGDAPNDESMFAAFPLAVGVANLAPQAHRLSHRPRWLTTADHGEGFIEFANHLLASR